MNPNEPRSSHPSSAQVETLVVFMEKKLSMAKGFLKTQNARERSRRQWEELAVHLNSIKNFKQSTKENDTLSPSHEAQPIQDADTDYIHVHNKSQAPTEEPPVIVIYGSKLIEDSQEHNYRLPDPAISRTLFASSSSATVGTSPSILQNIQ